MSIKTISFLLVDRTEAVISGDPSRLKSVKRMVSVNQDLVARLGVSATVSGEFINDPVLVALLYEVVHAYRQLEALE